MAFVVAPSKNKILQAAWAGHVAAQRAESKASKAKAKPEVHSEPAKPAKVAADVHKKAGKVHTKPAAKKKAKR